MWLNPARWCHIGGYAAVRPIDPVACSFINRRIIRRSGYTRKCQGFRSDIRSAKQPFDRRQPLPDKREARVVSFRPGAGFLAQCECQPGPGEGTDGDA
jgi:hypothetical protein